MKIQPFLMSVVLIGASFCSTLVLAAEGLRPSTESSLVLEEDGFILAQRVRQGQVRQGSVRGGSRYYSRPSTIIVTSDYRYRSRESRSRAVGRTLAAGAVGTMIGASIANSNAQTRSNSEEVLLNRSSALDNDLYCQELGYSGFNRIRNECEPESVVREADPCLQAKEAALLARTEEALDLAERRVRLLCPE